MQLNCLRLDRAALRLILRNRTAKRNRGRHFRDRLDDDELLVALQDASDVQQHFGRERRKVDS